MSNNERNPQLQFAEELAGQTPILFEGPYLNRLASCTHPGIPLELAPAHSRSPLEPRSG